MTTNGMIDIFKRMLRSLGAENKGILYASVPITSGRREIKLMNRFGCSREELRNQYKSYRQKFVIQPNEVAAENFTSRLEIIFPHWKILNPAAVYIAHWGQDEYMTLWENLINGYAVSLAITSGWAYSSGSRIEVGAGLKLGLPIYDHNGCVVSMQRLVKADTRARQTLRREGWSIEKINKYLPQIEFVRHPMSHLDERNRALPAAMSYKAMLTLGR